MKKPISLLFIVLLFSSLLFSQNAFNKIYNFTGSIDEPGQVITTDCGYVICGHTNKFDTYSDILVTKLNNDGVVIWSKTYGLPGKSERTAYITKLALGGYAIVGRDLNGSYGDGSGSIVVFKIDEAGNLVWSRYLDFPKTDHGNAITETASGNILIAGQWDDTETQYDAILISLSPAGALNWAYRYGTSLTDEVGNDVIENSAGEIIMLATKDSTAGDRDLIIYNISPNGNSYNWKVKLGTYHDERGSAIIQTASGGYAVSGQTGINCADPGCSVFTNNTWNIFAAEVSNAAPPTLNWMRSIGDMNNTERGYDISQRPGDKNFWLISQIYSPGNPDDMGAIQISDGPSGGTVNTFNTYGQNTTAQEAWIPTGAATGDDGFIGLSGYTDFSLFKTYSNGDPLCNVNAYTATNGTLSNTGAPLYVRCSGTYAPTPILSTPLFGDAGFVATNVNIIETTNCLIPSNVLVADTASTPASCGANNGSASTFPSGGTAPYSYSWNNNQTTGSITGLGAGTYSVVVSDALNCTVIKTFNINNSSGLTATTIFSHPACNQNNGTAGISATGGNGNYTYSWSNAQTTQNISNLGGGTYSITITDQSGCSYSASVTLTATNLFSVTATTTNTGCTTSNGSATVTPGGSGTYTYSWHSPLTYTTAVATGLGAGTYSLTITDNIGCSKDTSVTIAIDNNLTVSTLSNNSASCGNTDGSATATAGGATSYNYSWSAGANGQTNSTVTGLAGGTHTVTVTDNNGCTATTTVDVNEANNTLAVDSNVTNAICTQNNGAANVTVTGGYPTYSYSWYSPLTSQTNASVTGLAAGTYSVLITDNLGCSKTSTVIIQQTPSPITVNNTPTNPTCNLSNGEISAAPSNGTGTYTYSWTGTTGSTSAISNLSPGTYSVLITDANGCTGTASNTLTNIPGPSFLSVSNDTIITSGTSIQLNATGGNTYSWTPSNGLSCTGCNNPVANPATTTTYVITSYDANSCSDIDSVTIFIEINCNGELFIPTAFSPNNDGVNDVFKVRGSCIDNFLLQIFNRWGEKVFESVDITMSWDGIYQGKMCDAGVFVFVLTGIYHTNGTDLYQKGNVTLAR